jgi:hypothetical protein
MNEHPILFSTPMVQAILAGRKTMTRRIFKDHPRLSSEDLSNINIKEWFKDFPDYLGSFCAYGKNGDLLWVREAFQHDGYGYLYKSYNSKLADKWKPSIHMPKVAALIWLRVTDISVERLKEISEDDAKSEGVEINGRSWKDYFDKTNDYGCGDAVSSFRSLWESINGKESWEANPWVWVISFEVVSTTGKPAGL